MSEKVTLPSGAVLDVTPLSYEKAWGVTQDIVRVVEKLNVDLKVFDFGNVSATDVLALRGPICTVLTSPEILSAVKLCFGGCTYNNLRIDSGTFEAKEARGDFLFAAFHAMKENAAPFFSGVTSLFATK